MSYLFCYNFCGHMLTSTKFMIPPRKASCNNLAILLLSSIFIFTACVPGPQAQTTFTTAAATAPANGWYTVYFTDPTDPSAPSFRGGIDENLVSAIDEARVSVDVAIFDLNLWSIRDALIRAKHRGLAVRLVTESDNMDEQEIQELKEAGIQVLGDRQEGLMHDKFAVIDRSEVWTGSMNFTTGGGYLDNNNLIRLRSSRLAEDYLVEFEQMFVEDHFGPGKDSVTPYSSMKVDSSLVEVYFSPQDGALEHILEAVRAAQESIYFMAYSFTADSLAEALIDRASAGVTVQGVFDRDQYHSNEGTEYDRLKAAGIDVRLDGNPRLMHHKVFIIDGNVVITGSYNFSRNAENSNDENTLIIHNQEIASQYLAEYQKIYTASQR